MVWEVVDAGWGGGGGGLRLRKKGQVVVIYGAFECEVIFLALHV